MRDFHHELIFHEHIDLEHKSITRVYAVLTVFFGLYLIAWAFDYAGSDLSILIVSFLLIFFLFYQDRIKLKNLVGQMKNGVFQSSVQSFHGIPPSNLTRSHFQ